MVVVSGEVRSSGSLDVENIVRETLSDIGYTDEAKGMDNNSVEVRAIIHEQSPEIAQGVDSDDVSEQGAGDQGLMFGFACKETEELMPLPIQIAQRLTERLATIRKDGTLSWLRPDGKSQVTVEYDGFTAIRVTKVVIATQHDDMLDKYGSEKDELSFVRKEVINHVIIPVLDSYDIPYESEFIVNGTGRFVMVDQRLIQGLQEGRSSLTHMEAMLLMEEAHFLEKIHQRLIVQLLICLDISVSYTHLTLPTIYSV